MLSSGGFDDEDEGAVGEWWVARMSIPFIGDPTLLGKRELTTIDSEIDIPGH